MSPAFSPALAPQRSLEDPLAYLPCSPVLEFRRGQTIYDDDKPSSSIFLVVSGKVTASRTTGDGKQVVLDIYQTDEFFGESAFLGAAHASEAAVAFENTKVMKWANSDIEEMSMKRPKLAVALMQLLVQRSVGFTERIESFSTDHIGRRLARALVRFSERFGSRQNDGSIQMIPFTHELLSQYVGTSREIITHYMNVFRKQGYLQYSRKSITLQRDALKDWLGQSV